MIKPIKLPYEVDALSPHISGNTVEVHYCKHHAGYANNLNNLIANNPEFAQGIFLEEIVIKSANNPELVGIFNNAAQVFNHDFYWQSMTPNGGDEIANKDCHLLHKIKESFGSLENFKEEFKKACLGQFGSGWCWLVAEKGTNKLVILKTANADCPIVSGHKALLVCDVWEHAYYLDYQNRRDTYVDSFLNNLVNWHFADRNYTLVAC